MNLPLPKLSTRGRQTLAYAVVTGVLLWSFLQSAGEGGSVWAALLPFGLPQAMAIPVSSASVLMARRNSVRAARLAFWASAIAMPTSIFWLVSACGTLILAPAYLVLYLFALIPLLLMYVLPPAVLLGSAIYSRKILLRAKAAASSSSVRL